jgi:hypothetical protein
VAWAVTVLCVGGAAWLVTAHLDKPESVAAPTQIRRAQITTAVPEPEPPKQEQKREKRKETPKPPPDIAQEPPDIVKRDVRKEEIEALREEIRSTLVGTAAKVHDKQFAAALEELAYLDRSAQRYPAELWRERDDIAHLRLRVMEGDLAERLRQQQEDAWKARVAAIESLIDREKFPEAIDAAQILKTDPQAPLPIAARAAELEAEARRRLREAAANEMRVGETKNTIRKPSSPPRKNP